MTRIDANEVDAEAVCTSDRFWQRSFPTFVRAMGCVFGFWHRLAPTFVWATIWMVIPIIVLFVPLLVLSIVDWEQVWIERPAWAFVGLRAIYYAGPALVVLVPVVAGTRHRSRDVFVASCILAGMALWGWCMLGGYQIFMLFRAGASELA